MFLITILRKMKNILDKFVEKLKTHFVLIIFFTRKSCLLWNKVEKYCRSGQGTDDNMAHAHCMLDNWGYL